MAIYPNRRQPVNVSVVEQKANFHIRSALRAISHLTTGCHLSTSRIGLMTICLRGSVSCGGWEGGVAVETEKTQSHAKCPKKRAAPPPSAARIVGHVRDIRSLDGKELLTMFIVWADIEAFSLIFALCGCSHNHRQMTLRAYCFCWVGFR